MREQVEALLKLSDRYYSNDVEIEEYAAEMMTLAHQLNNQLPAEEPEVTSMPANKQYFTRDQLMPSYKALVELIKDLQISAVVVTKEEIFINHDIEADVNPVRVVNYDA